MTIGAKRLPIFEVPRGWIRNSRMRMPQVDPTMVDLLMLGWTTCNLFYQLANDTCESQKRFPEADPLHELSVCCGVPVLWDRNYQKERMHLPLNSA